MLLLAYPLPEWVRQQLLPLYGLTLALLLAVGGLALRPLGAQRLAARLLGGLPGGIGRAMLHPLNTLLQSLQLLRQARATATILGWAAVSWGTAVANNWFLLEALALPAPPVAALLVLVLVQLGISLAAVPATIGVFEYLCVLALGLFGVDASAALSFGLLLHALVLMPTPLGLWLAWQHGVSRAQLARLPPVQRP